MSERVVKWRLSGTSEVSSWMVIIGNSIVTMGSVSSKIKIFGVSSWIHRYKMVSPDTIVISVFIGGTSLRVTMKNFMGHSALRF